MTRINNPKIAGLMGLIDQYMDGIEKLEAERDALQAENAELRATALECETRGETIERLQAENDYVTKENQRIRLLIESLQVQRNKVHTERDRLASQVNDLTAIVNEVITWPGLSFSKKATAALLARLDSLVEQPAAETDVVGNVGPKRTIRVTAKVGSVTRGQPFVVESDKIKPSATCETCGGTKRVGYVNLDGYEVKTSSGPCPDCQGQPTDTTGMGAESREQ